MVVDRKIQLSWFDSMMMDLLPCPPERRFFEFDLFSISMVFPAFIKNYTDVAHFSNERSTTTAMLYYKTADSVEISQSQTPETAKQTYVTNAKTNAH